MTTVQPTKSPSVSNVLRMVETAQASLGMSDADLCSAAGFERPITLSLIKSGAIKLPLTKVPTLAVALGIDPATLLRAALMESSPELVAIIESTFDPLKLTLEEVQIIQRIRRSSDAPAPVPHVTFGSEGVEA